MLLAESGKRNQETGTRNEVHKAYVGVTCLPAPGAARQVTREPSSGYSFLIPISPSVPPLAPGSRPLRPT